MMQQSNGEGYPGQQDPAVSTQTKPEGKATSQKDFDAPAQEAPMSDDSNNPLYILAVITLGIPVVALILLVATNPGVQEGTLSTLAMFLVLAAFAVAAMFEIKRLADQPPSNDSH